MAHNNHKGFQTVSDGDELTTQKEETDQGKVETNKENENNASQIILPMFNNFDPSNWKHL